MKIRLGNKDEIRQVLEALKIKETDKPITIPKNLEEIMFEQSIIFQLNENYIDIKQSTLGPVAGDIFRDYFNIIINKFYLITYNNLNDIKNLKGSGLFFEGLSQIGWAHFLVHSGLTDFLDESGEGLFQPAFNYAYDSFPKSTLQWWAKNNGFTNDFYGFIQWIKKGGKYDYRMESSPAVDVFFLVSFVEAILKAEEGTKEKLKQSGLLYSKPSAYGVGSTGLSIICPLFFDAGQLAQRMVNGDYFIKLEYKSKE